MVKIKVKRTVAATPEQIRSVLLAHADLGRFFNAHFTLLTPQEPGEITGGKGTIREIKMQGTTFKEQIIAADNSHISYCIIGSKPVAKHRGDIYNLYYSRNSEAGRFTCTTVTWLMLPRIEQDLEKSYVILRNAQQ
mgnify:CR=1 FL=1